MKKKVLIYITRTKNERTELLVFKHRDFPDAGIQVPAGSVEGDEEIEDAAIRETQEESGISLTLPISLAPTAGLGRILVSYRRETFFIFI